ncbi:pyrimidine 5'-nucleotidase [Noviherbaspirillum sp. UKPF54]|uniref:pyrimidine 5'-nucleotidase n=1 Tax=Noviherbaspirillum sp. UKPF54 TaxID=2601898 RepID=UPI0011B155F8|nr:pyrimidine 5'-nucleotidase [Noviherbaspirillum sp. UKPF54]QDZ29166.1 pyrimidine 5'-nucleotidase [Noviherbaspirillum sp. UKPF54]
MPKPIWLFDLDNTLHNASHAIFPAINANMNAFIAKVLGDGDTPADPDTVNAARLAYWKRYGATLLGMVRHHQVRMDDFLREAHRFDDLPSMIRAERGLGQLLRRLPGRKILLTNAPRRYSHDVMRHLGLHRHFAKHIAIEAMHVHRQLRPKPSRHLLRKLVAKERIAPSRCVLVEDSVDTLKAAKAIGMRTVWITQYLATSPNLRQLAGNRPLPRFTKRPIYVDVKVQSVMELPTTLHRLR